MLPQTSGTDSATTHKICDHAMLTTSGDRCRHNANRQTLHIHELIIKEQKIFLQLVVAGMDPVVPEDRARVPKKLADGLLVAHRLDLTCDHVAVNVNVNNRSQNLSLQLSCQRRRAGSGGLARFVLGVQFVICVVCIALALDRIVIAC